MSSSKSAGSGPNRPRSAGPGPAKPAMKKMGSKKIGTDLVVLSSVAIMSVYGIGYQRTFAGANALASLDSSNVAQASADSAAPTPVATVIAQAVAQATQTQNPSPASAASVAGTPTASGSAAKASPTGAPTPRAIPTATAAAKIVPPTATVAKAGQYRDGTFVGQGFSRHGGIEATVVITGGKIVSADITDCSTRYPCDAAYPLIPEVVSRQAAPIHHISGATDSSMAYHDAVIKALAQAV